ncbi:hypothetical protein [Streptomyces sp. NPDC000410]|uniref:hypothetical protein n=1 Tax=Streptomyces sp. NPDC000410 TaxID=3154254 RepID=UPI0033189749
MSTTRRPLGTGPRPNSAPAEDRTDRGRTVVELAARVAGVPSEEQPRRASAARRQLGAGPSVPPR